MHSNDILRVTLIVYITNRNQNIELSMPMRQERAEPKDYSCIQPVLIRIVLLFFNKPKIVYHIASLSCNH